MQPESPILPASSSSTQVTTLIPFSKLMSTPSSAPLSINQSVSFSVMPSGLSRNFMCDIRFSVKSVSAGEYIVKPFWKSGSVSTRYAKRSSG